ncbi:MAG: HAD-IIA family hydrolase [Lachnospira sp.]|nr:HAD-IIA family hydrolase [Lachnospira sp.]
MKYRDYFGCDCSELCDKKLFLLDMDGTIYEENRLFDGTLTLLEKIKAKGGRYVFITNNSSKSVADYIKKVTDMGIEADEDSFFTSSQATVMYLKENHPDAIVYCQGTHSLVEELEKSGINVVCDVDERASVVLVGFDTEITGQKLRNTCEMLGKDVTFIATNPDMTCPVSFGFIPDCGSMCYMLEVATGKKPIYIGKPEPTMVNIVCEKFKYSKEETVVIGDRIYTDVAAGLNAGVSAVCVLSGEVKLKDIEESDIKPSYTLESVKNYADML